jgi:hypothetical protein
MRAARLVTRVQTGINRACFQPARAMSGTAFQATLDEAKERDAIKEAVSDLCADFPGSYWRELDKTSTCVNTNLSIV